MKDDVNRVFVAADWSASLRSHDQGRGSSARSGQRVTAEYVVDHRALKWLRLCTTGRVRQDRM